MDFVAPGFPVVQDEDFRAGLVPVGDDDVRVIIPLVALGAWGVDRVCGDREIARGDRAGESLGELRALRDVQLERERDLEIPENRGVLPVFAVLDVFGELAGARGVDWT